MFCKEERALAGLTQYNSSHNVQKQRNILFGLLSLQRMRHCSMTMAVTLILYLGWALMTMTARVLQLLIYPSMDGPLTAQSYFARLLSQLPTRLLWSTSDFSKLLMSFWKMFCFTPGAARNLGLAEYQCCYLETICISFQSLLSRKWVWDEHGPRNYLTIYLLD